MFYFQGGGSDLVSVACFGFRVSMMFQLIFVHYTGLLSGHFFGNSCPLGWPYVLIVFCLFEIKFIFHFGFKSGIWLLIAPVPVHCFSITFRYFQTY